MRKVSIALAVLALAAGAIAANVALLGAATSRNDPVGKLSPRAVLTGTSPAGPAAPSTPPARGGGEREHADD